MAKLGPCGRHLLINEVDSSSHNRHVLLLLHILQHLQAANGSNDLASFYLELENQMI